MGSVQKLIDQIDPVVNGLVKTQAERYIELPSMVFDLMPYIPLLGEQARREVSEHIEAKVIEITDPIR